MDLFDRRILAVLKDGKPRGFQQVLSEVDFSRSTLRLHLASLERQGMILKAKTLKSSPGRPSFTYSSPPETKQRVALALIEPHTTIVSLTFQKLRHICRFEKGGYCKNMRTKCEAQICPQIIKGQ